MEHRSHRLHARSYIDDMASRGRYHFTSSEAREALGVSADAARQALNRLSRRNLIASPARGFYVILPPEYRSLGCLPAAQFIPELMDRLGVPYYAGLLSAAEYHGAAHHRPQEFQVLSPIPRRRMRCGRVRVAFITRKNVRDVATRSLNTPRGVVRVSTPEATAIDLAGYPHRAAGIDNVATVLAELAESLDREKLVPAARTAPISWAQRLGYLLELVDARDAASALKNYVRQEARLTVPLLPRAGARNGSRDPDWKLVVNVEVEPEL